MSSSSAVLLLNLGTPSQPTVAGIRRYLAEFLSDPRVIDVPALTRMLLVYGIILPIRPFKIKSAYLSIWQDTGSPLLHHTETLAEKIAANLDDAYDVYFAMRYGSPSIKAAINNIKNKNYANIIIFPLFPQYASSTTGSAVEKTLSLIQKFNNVPSIHVVRDFFNDAAFIKAQKIQLQQSLDQHKPQHVLFSYHGLPERHIIKSGCASVCQEACPPVNQANQYCYRAQCFATTEAIAKALDLKDDYYSISFQSRLGRLPWIKPYTDHHLETLIKKGVKRLLVTCPAFVADCLETLEEIGIRAKEQWLALGGESLELSPCLNASASWVEAASQIIQKTSLPSQG